MAISYKVGFKVSFAPTFLAAVKAAFPYDLNIPPAREYNAALAICFEADLNIIPDSIDSTEAFGTPALDVCVLVSSILTEEGFGSPALAPVLLIGGIPSGEAFGSPLLLTVIADAGGIYSGEAFGSPSLVQIIMGAGGIPSDEALGEPILGLILLPSGIASQESIGSPLFAPTLLAEGIPSEEYVQGPLLRLPKVLQRIQTEIPISGIRFGLKKLAEAASLKVGLVSKFGLTPLAVPPEAIDFSIIAPDEIYLYGYYFSWFPNAWEYNTTLTVTGMTGDPESGVLVTIYDQFLAVVSQGTTDEDGKITFELQTGSYTYTGEKGDWIGKSYLNFEPGQTNYHPQIESGVVVASIDKTAYLNYLRWGFSLPYGYDSFSRKPDFRLLLSWDNTSGPDQTDNTMVVSATYKDIIRSKNITLHIRPAIIPLQESFEFQRYLMDGLHHFTPYPGTKIFGRLRYDQGDGFDQNLYSNDYVVSTSFDGYAVVEDDDITIDYFYTDLRRIGMIFDTSGIPEGFEIKRAEISFDAFYQTKNCDLPYPEGGLCLVRFGTFSADEIVAADFFHVGTQLMSDTIIVPVEGDPTHRVFGLNTDGIAQIIKGGKSAFGLSLDVDRTYGYPSGHGYAGFDYGFSWCVMWHTYPVKLTVWRT